MPIYEYQCEQCEHVFEEWQKDFSERSMECPECGAASQRLISNTAFILKGSGWYVTDYARNNGSNGGNGSNGTNGTSEKKSDDAKSAVAEGGEAKKADAPKKDAAAKAPKESGSSASSASSSSS